MYSHWFSYEIALKHLDAEVSRPIEISVLSAVFLVVIRILEVEKKTKKLALLRYVLIVILIASVFASHFNGSCPACNEVHDPVYKYIYKMVHGSEYEWVW